MKEKRNQKDDRQWKADQPNNSAFYRSHPNLAPGKQLSVAVLVPGRRGLFLSHAMIRYETGPWRFQVNASNLADKRHVTTCLARGDCFFGIGRTVLGSATYRF